MTRPGFSPTRRFLLIGTAVSLLPISPTFMRAIAAEKSLSKATLLKQNLNKMAARLKQKLRGWSGPRRVFTPEQYGTPLDTTSKVTFAIQSAIDDLAKLGGGTVRLAKGDYVSGTITLRSNIRLEVTAAARLLGSLNLADYPDHVATRPTVMDSNMGMNQSLLFAEGCTNIAICGKGEIDGRGDPGNFPGRQTTGPTPGRPFLIRIIDCTQVHVADIKLRNAACWMQNYLNCENLLIERIDVRNQVNHNNDGLDIDGCRNVVVRDCFINSEDDALCFKGASMRPTEDVLVEHCTFFSNTNAIKFGTDSQGDFRRVLVRHCKAGGVPLGLPAKRRLLCDSGISWECVDGGTIEDVLVYDVQIERTKSPLFVRLGNRARTRPELSVPSIGNIRNVVFEKITGRQNGARGSFFLGMPEKRIEDVTLIDVNLHGESLQGEAALDPKLDEAAFPEKPRSYPDAHMYGATVPAYGLWARHVGRIELIRTTFTASATDPRPMIFIKTNVPSLRVDH